MEEQLYKLKKLLSMLDKLKGKHTELISVFIPKGYSLNEINNMLANEVSLTQNVKSKTVRKNVTDALTKIIQHLKLYRQTPENGLVIFCGNVSEQEGKTDIELWSIEPPKPINIKLYWCDQKFKLEPLEEMIAEKEVYGLVVIDNSEASIGLLKGKRIELLRRLESIVPSKVGKGGQCLSLDSMVITSDGNIEPIKYLNTNLSVKSLDFNTLSISDSIVLDFFETKKGPVYKIITKFPKFEIKCSKDHFVLVFDIDNGEIIEKRAEELKIGDILIAPEKIYAKGEIQTLNNDYFESYKITKEGLDILKRKRLDLGLSQKKLGNLIKITQANFSTIERGTRNFSTCRLNLLASICSILDIDFQQFRFNYLRPASKTFIPNILNEKLAQMLGYFLGDGNFDKNRLCFSEGEKKLANFYFRFFKKLFNVGVSKRFRSNKSYYEIRIYSKVVTNFIRGEFSSIKDSKNSLIPSKVLKSENKGLASFLKGLYDAEGYITDYIGLGINNEALARQVQLSLLRFGILSSINEYDNKRNLYTKKHRFTVQIGEKRSLETFKKYIGFSLRQKYKELDNLINQRTSSVNRLRRVLCSGKIVRKLVEDYGMRKKDFPKVSNFFQNKRYMSKGVFQKSLLDNITNEDLYSQLKFVLDTPIIPVIIHKIEKLDISLPMVDIATKHQNFIANGIFVHNSQQRYERVREGLINDWYKKVAETIRELPANIKGIILGGPGPAKNNFYEGNYLLTELKNKILGVKDVGYTDEYGLEELVQRSQDLLKEAAVAREKELCQKFFEELNKDSGMVTYGKESVKNALENGAVDIVLISEGLEEETVEEFEKLAKHYGSKIEIISTDTREGEQLFQLGGIAAILRWKFG